MLPKTCTIPECGKPLGKYGANGMCRPHYDANRPPCSIKGCSKPIVAREWCSAHYTRWKRHGSPLLGGMPRVIGSLSDKFWFRVDKTITCWNWIGSLSDTGYGHFVENKVDRLVHRLSWELHNGRIPKGMHVDHTCHNKACVNPAHLRLATPKQNTENHSGPSRANKTGVRGVYFSKNLGKFVGQVTHNRVTHHVGVFLDLRDAEAAVIAKRNELHTFNDLDRK